MTPSETKIREAAAVLLTQYPTTTTFEAYLEATTPENDTIKTTLSCPKRV